MSDIDAGKLLEVIDSHQQQGIIEVLEQQPLEVRSQVQEVSVDMWGPMDLLKLVHPSTRILRHLRVLSIHGWTSLSRFDVGGGFAKVVAEVFPNATLVYDRFHVTKPVNEELNKVRKQVGITLKGSKFMLLKNGVDLTVEEKEKLETILKQSKRLRLAYDLKEEFRQLFETDYTVEQGSNKTR